MDSEFNEKFRQIQGRCTVPFCINSELTDTTVLRANDPNLSSQWLKILKKENVAWKRKHPTDPKTMQLCLLHFEDYESPVPCKLLTRSDLQRHLTRLRVSLADSCKKNLNKSVEVLDISDDETIPASPQTHTPPTSTGIEIITPISKPLEDQPILIAQTVVNASSEPNAEHEPIPVTLCSSDEEDISKKSPDEPIAEPSKPDKPDTEECVIDLNYLPSTQVQPGEPELVESSAYSIETEIKNEQILTPDPLQISTVEQTTKSTNDLRSDRVIVRLLNNSQKSTSIATTKHSLEMSTIENEHPNKIPKLSSSTTIKHCPEILTNENEQPDKIHKVLNSLTVTKPDLLTENSIASSLLNFYAKNPIPMSVALLLNNIDVNKILKNIDNNQLTLNTNRSAGVSVPYTNKNFERTSIVQSVQRDSTSKETSIPVTPSTTASNCQPLCEPQCNENLEEPEIYVLSNPELPQTIDPLIKYEDEPTNSQKPLNTEEFSLNKEESIAKRLKEPGSRVTRNKNAFIDEEEISASDELSDYETETFTQDDYSEYSDNLTNYDSKTESQENEDALDSQDYEDMILPDNYEDRMTNSQVYLNERQHKRDLTKSDSSLNTVPKRRGKSHKRKSKNLPKSSQIITRSHQRITRASKKLILPSVKTVAKTQEKAKQNLNSKKKNISTRKAFKRNFSQKVRLTRSKANILFSVSQVAKQQNGLKTKLKSAEKRIEPIQLASKFRDNQGVKTLSRQKISVNSSLKASSLRINTKNILQTKPGVSSSKPKRNQIVNQTLVEIINLELADESDKSESDEPDESESDEPDQSEGELEPGEVRLNPGEEVEDDGPQMIPLYYEKLKENVVLDENSPMVAENTEPLPVITEVCQIIDEDLMIIQYPN